MSTKKTRIILLVLTIIFFAAGIMLGSPHDVAHLSLQEAMKDAVLHDIKRVGLFGLTVNPSVISAFIVSLVILFFAIIVRLFVVPKFKRVPGKLQYALESLVHFFTNLAKTNSPHKNKVLSSYIFAAGIYIAVSTLFELVGVQVIATTGHLVTLPAPLSDLNAAVAMGVFTYLFIMSGGISANGFGGILKTLKEFSLPVSMSFRLFGALVSGLLVMDLVYHSLALSIGLPVVVAVLFTLLHALIQAYVLTMLTSIFYGEVTEKHIKIK